MEEKEQLGQEPILNSENEGSTASEIEETAPLSEVDQLKLDLADQ